jgi:hypothetical protein
MIPMHTPSTQAVVLAQPTQQAKPKPKMKKWPDNGTLVSYIKLIKPLKAIIDHGYRLFRKDITSFDYNGYNIGKDEQRIYPSPKVQFEVQSLVKEKARGNNLIDIVLNIAFLLGVEQGRRSERTEQEQTDNMLNTLENYRERNKDLRRRNDQIEAMLLLKEQYPALQNAEIASLADEIVLQKRNDRIEEARAELALDQSRSSLNRAQKKRAKFGELVELSRTLNRNICSLEDWLDILKDHGWTAKEWTAKCDKKKIKTEYN